MKSHTHKHALKLMIVNQKAKVKKYTFSTKLSFSSIGQEKSKQQKQTSKLLILIETTAFFVKLPFQLRQVIYLFVSVALISVYCIVLTD